MGCSKEAILLLAVIGIAGAGWVSVPAQGDREASALRVASESGESGKSTGKSERRQSEMKPGGAQSPIQGGPPEQHSPHQSFGSGNRGTGLTGPMVPEGTSGGQSAGGAPSSGATPGGR